MTKAHTIRKPFSRLASRVEEVYKAVLPWLQDVASLSKCLTDWQELRLSCGRLKGKAEDGRVMQESLAGPS